VKPAVLNASPLIILARAGYIDVVPTLLSPVVIPRAVVAEVKAGPPEDAAVKLLANSSWVSVADLNPPLFAARRLALGTR
jgi:predicted nucleic acid-binding protein